MFEKINLKKLNLEELRILLQSIDLYVHQIEIGEFQGRLATEEIENSLSKFGDKICEVIQEKEL